MREVFLELNQYLTNEVCDSFNRMASPKKQLDTLSDLIRGLTNMFWELLLELNFSIFVKLVVRLFNRMKSQKSCGKHFLYRIDFWLGSVLWEINKIKSFIDKLVIKRFHSIEIHYSYVNCGKAIVVPNQ